MGRVLSVIVLLGLISAATADGPAKGKPIDAKTAWAWASISPAMPSKPADATTAWAWAGGTANEPKRADVKQSKAYSDAYDRAIAGHRPLVLFVGVPDRPLADCEHVRYDAAPGTDGPAVLVGVPNGQQLVNVAKFSGDLATSGKLTDNQIRASWQSSCPNGNCPLRQKAFQW